MKKYLLIFSIFGFLFMPLNAQWIDAYIADFKVNDDNLNSYQTNSQIGVDSAGNFVIVWRDVRAFPGFQTPARNYCQRYNKDGLALGNNFIIGQDSVRHPVITVLPDGRFIVCWIRNFRIGTSSRSEMFFQRFGINGQPLSIPIKVIDSVFINATEIINGYTISSKLTGEFIVVWDHFKTGDEARVYFQRFDSTGNKIGEPLRTNEGTSKVMLPELAVNYDGSFVIVWQDDRNNIFYNKYDIYMQRYDANGIKIGNNIKVNDDTNTMIEQLGADVSTDGNGFTVVAWSDERLFSPYATIFYQQYNQNGSPVGVNRRADINANFGAGTGVPKVDMRQDRKFYISWVDLSYAGKEQVYGRRFDVTGNSVGNPYMIPATSPGNSRQAENTLYLLGDRVFTSWSDDRNGGQSNVDIYCNVRGFQNPDTVIGIQNLGNIANDYRLPMVYPNPFNPETNIKYRVSKNNTFVKITIFDITGREIEAVVNRKQNAGLYKISWNAGSLPSGIYFITINTNTGFTDTKKIILIK